MQAYWSNRRCPPKPLLGATAANRAAAALPTSHGVGDLQGCDRKNAMTSIAGWD
jgi:hypothetical protein